MTPAQQERFVAAVTKSMAEAHEGPGQTAVRSGTRNRILGASGFRHQVDVSVSTVQDLVLYECKYWGRNVGPDAVLAFAARGLDIQHANPSRKVTLSIVVKQDLTSGARLLAEHFGVCRQIAKSAAEFAVAYKSDNQIGTVDGATLGEHAEARLFPSRHARRGVQPNKRLKLTGAHK